VVDDPFHLAAALLHAAATWVMVGVIWFVQLVHYPLMDRLRVAPASVFAEFEKTHQRRTTMIVAPAMLIELVAAVWLAAFASTPAGRWLAWIGLGLVGVNALSTALLQMPCHRRLEAGFDPFVHRRLVRTNRLRTAAWSLRGVIAAALIAV
jgi:hypothetical protein